MNTLLPARRPALTLSLVLLGVLALVGVRGCLPEGRLYRLAPESVFLDGCFGDCLCPVRLSELSGTFQLAELPILAPGPNRVFSVSDVRWRIERGDESLPVRGEGLYQNDPVNGTHRMTLKLSVGDAPAVQYDSGRLEGGREFPEIAIRFSQFMELACTDTVFDIRAAPVPDPEPECLDNAGCREGELCIHPTGQCEAGGACLERPDACLTVYDPVCGCDGHSYGNECEAFMAGVSVASEGLCPGEACRYDADCSDAAYCQKPDGACGGEGACMGRPDGCPLVFLPVCGCDGRTYGNRCEAARAGASVASEGPCGDPGCRSNADCAATDFCAKPAGRCDAAGECTPRPEACIQVYDPVCGCDGRTYGNGCSAASAGVPVDFEGVCP